jgi:hypothetical protein
MRSTLFLAGLLSLALLATNSVSRAADKDEPTLLINKRGDDEKKFVGDVAVAIIKAARSAPKDPKFVEYKTEKPAEGRTTWVIKGEYSGSLTGKKFASDITIKIDTLKKDAWEVLSIEYSDDNKVSPAKPNETNINNLVKKLNGK